MRLTVTPKPGFCCATGVLIKVPTNLDGSCALCLTDTAVDQALDAARKANPWLTHGKCRIHNRLAPAREGQKHCACSVCSILWKERR